jgi:hypothetical protein
MTAPSSLIAAIVLVAALLSAAPSFAAGPESAQGLYDRGFEAFKAGRYDEACPALERSYELEPLPGALFTLAECEAKRGRLAVAASRYDEYLRVYAALPPDKQARQAEREKVARATRAAIAARIAELTPVLPPGAPRETRVTRDGTPVPAAALGVPALVDPGEHVITVQVPGGPASEMRITLAPGERKGVALDARQGMATAITAGGAAPDGAPQGEGANRALLIAGGTVAGAAAVTGAVLTGLWASKGSSASSLAGMVPHNAPCPAGGVVTSTTSKTCSDLVSALNTQATFGNAAIGMFVTAGAVGAATLIYGLVASPRGGRSGPLIAPTVTAQGGGLFARGSF